MLEESSGFSYSNFHETDSDLLTTSRTRGESGSGEVGERAAGSSLRPPKGKDREGN